MLRKKFLDRQHIYGIGCKRLNILQEEQNMVRSGAIRPSQIYILADEPSYALTSAPVENIGI